MEETIQEVQVLWYVIPQLYEKWVNPANKNDKHYRVIFRSNTGGRRVGIFKFKRAFDAQTYAARFDLRLYKEGKCTKR